MFLIAMSDGEGRLLEIKKVSELKISLHASALGDIIQVCRAF
jgi:hypothetical protein